jgi:hypothetical protein
MQVSQNQHMINFGVVECGLLLFAERALEHAREVVIAFDFRENLTAKLTAKPVDDNRFLSICVD